HDQSLNVPESVGLLAHDTEQKVVDVETGERILGPGEVGEICVRGPQVMEGYWKAPEATAAAIRDGWLYTGDIGYVDARGYTFIQDRKKEMIKHKGFGIAPAEIEALLFEHPGVADAAVIGKPDAEAGEVPKAFVVRGAGPGARENLRSGESGQDDDKLPKEGGVRGGLRRSSPSPRRRTSAGAGASPLEAEGQARSPASGPSASGPALGR